MSYEYKGNLYPDYLKLGNAVQYIKPIADQFCKGRGLDIGCGKWVYAWSIPIELRKGSDAMKLPDEQFDYIFSSHCLEHLPFTINALNHWKSRLKKGAPLFLYLPHPDMEYWLPQNCDKHLHSWTPKQMVKILTDLGFKDILHSERDMAWSYAVVAYNE